MKIIVTTCQKNLHLLKDFYLLAEKFLTHPIYTDVAHKGETKSEQLLRIANDGDDAYITILEEDFYLAEEVDISLLYNIFSWSRDVEADRFSLQSKNAHSHSDWHHTILKIRNHHIYQTNLDVTYPFSLEASVWRKDFLIEHLTGLQLDDGMIENTVCNKIREQRIPVKVYALDIIVMTYLDMMRGGKNEIEFYNDIMEFHGDPIALFPDGSSEEGVRCL